MTAKTETSEQSEVQLLKEIATNDLHQLGMPPHYRQTDVKILRPGTARVNVHVSQGDLFKTSKITDSFFLKFAPDGVITGGDKIVKKY